MDLTMMERVGDRKKWKDLVRQVKAHLVGCSASGRRRRLSLLLLMFHLSLMYFVKKAFCEKYVTRRE
jgi:hypothetical protein